MYRYLGITFWAATLVVAGVQPAFGQSATPDPETTAAADPEPYVTVPAGTRIPLVMINSVSSRHSMPGDPIYLESVYPVVVDGRILIPTGTHVSGSVILSKRPGRIKGRGKLQVELEQMILPNGVIRDLTGRPGALDGRSPDSFDRETGEIKSQGTKGEDATDIATATATGASIGSIAGAIGGRGGRGLGVGALAGAAAGTASVLLTRGPDAMLDRGTHIEMLLEAELRFTEAEVQFDRGTGTQRPGGIGAGPDPTRNRRDGVRDVGRGPIGRRFPL